MWIITPRGDLLDLTGVSFIQKNEDYQDMMFHIDGTFKSDGRGFVIMTHPSENRRDEYFEYLNNLLVKENK